MAEQRCERVLGKCEICGAEGEINRYSRPIEGQKELAREIKKLCRKKRSNESE